VALTNATVGYAIALARKGWKTACREDPALARGLNVVHGHVTHPGVAEAHGLPFTPAEELLREA
jgi:alanine dehydrogenase